MNNYLETLRAKPKHVRSRIAFVTSSFIFALIFSGWLFTKQSPSADQSLALSKASSPLSVVANTFSGFTSETGSMVSAFQQNLNDLQNESAKNKDMYSDSISSVSPTDFNQLDSSSTLQASTSDVSSNGEAQDIFPMTFTATSTANQ